MSIEIGIDNDYVDAIKEHYKEVGIAGQARNDAPIVRHSALDSECNKDSTTPSFLRKQESPAKNEIAGQVPAMTALMLI